MPIKDLRIRQHMHVYKLTCKSQNRSFNSIKTSPDSCKYNGRNWNTKRHCVYQTTAHP